MSAALIVLAAGQGSRMLSDRPKVLHEIGNAPMLAHALGTADALAPERTVVVVGHGGEAVADALTAIAPEADVVWQKEQLGTGHAVLQARAALDKFDGDAFVLFGDTPFITAETLARMDTARKDGADLVVLGFESDDPARYGRLVTDGDALLKIVEWKDATETERAIRLCNSGLMCMPAKMLFELLERVDTGNAAGEVYLTDVAGLAVARGLTAKVVLCAEAETQGINTRADLAAAEAAFQTQSRVRALEAGVTLVAPDTVHFSLDTHLGRDSHVEPYVVFGPGVTVESGATIRAFSHLEGAHVSNGAVVGPYARLRPGAELAEGVRVGNFVEVKNAQVAEGAKINHLSYVGDASIGRATNIGAGTITCNYDGVMKHRTEIGARVFIGSNTMLVAPITVGDDAMTATGTVVTRDVPATAMAIGRAPQENKQGLATRLFERLRAIKKKK
ncbi:MAG: bifunctional UDP-N-acetylglucosamine diphosphorylase/glucosamine-1-phosphate N-acetyltransferase GlmU [Pseudomonadota bacterium]